MTPKWTIRKYSTREDGPVWVATAPDVRLVQEKVWVNNFLPSDRYKYCDTFAEAIAWVTRKARTVEVELPKVVEIRRLEIANCDDLVIHAFGRYTSISNGWGDWGMDVEHAQLKPLAEYLLALHYEKENK